MAEYGEWNEKGASLSHVTAAKEYGVSLDFILEGIRAGKLEYREGVMWGNPWVRILRRQLEKYIVERLGEKELRMRTQQKELRKINREIGSFKRKLAALQAKKAELENEN